MNKMIFTDSFILICHKHCRYFSCSRIELAPTVAICLYHAVHNGSLPEEF